MAGAAAAGAATALLASPLAVARVQSTIDRVRDREILVGLVLLEIVFLAAFWTPATEFWRRYRRTYTLNEPPLMFSDVVAVFSGSTGIFFFFVADVQLKPLPHPIGIIPGIFIIWVTASLLNSRRSERAKPRSADLRQTSGDYPDDPIANDEEDLLGRVPFVEGLYQQMLNLPFQNSFVFGLHGKWGEGKTSVLNLLRNRLEKVPAILVVEFNPWYWRGDEAVVSGFYTVLEQRIRQRYIFSGLHATLRRYRRLLTIGVERTGLRFGFAIPDDPELVRAELELWVAHTGCRVVVLIDDIDRLSDYEVLAVLKLATLSARLKNTVFLLAFDVVIVREILRDRLRVDPTFVDKVIQKAISLPPAQQLEIDKFLLFSLADGHRSAIDGLLDELSVAEARRAEFDEKFVYIYRTCLSRLFTTLRQAKRYINGLRAGLPSVVNNVNLYDFFLLEAIRTTSQRVYDDIWQRPWFYVPSWTTESLLASPLKVANADDENRKAIRGHIAELLRGEGNGEIVQAILEELFFIVKDAFAGRSVGRDGVAEEYRREKRLTHPECLPTYFYLRIPAGELSDSEVEGLIRTWNGLAAEEAEAQIARDIEQYREKGQLRELLERIHLFRRYVGSMLVRTTVQVLYRLAPSLSREGELWNSEYDRAEGLMLRLINDQAEDQDIRPLVYEIGKEAPGIHLATLVVLSLQRGRASGLSRIAAHVAPEEVRKLVAERLREHFLEQGRDIFGELPSHDAGFVLYQWGTDWMTSSNANREVVRTYIRRLLERQPGYVAKLLNLFVRKPRPRGEPGFDYSEFTQVFDAEEIHGLVARLEVSSLPNDERQAIRLFSEIHGRTKPPGDSSRAVDGKAEDDSV